MTTRDRVMSELHASPRPLRATVIASRIGAPIISVRAALSELRRARLVHSAWFGSLVLVRAWDSLPMYLDQRRQREQRDAREARMSGRLPRERAPRGGEPLRTWVHRQVGAMTDDQLRRLVRHIGRMR